MMNEQKQIHKQDGKLMYEILEQIANEQTNKVEACVG